MNDSQPPRSRSSLLHRLPPDLRRQVDQAILDRDPPSYAGVVRKFRLAEYGVRDADFIYYARNLRLQAALRGPRRSPAECVQSVLSAIAQRLARAAADKTTDPQFIRELQRSQRSFARLQKDVARHEAQKAALLKSSAAAEAS